MEEKQVFEKLTKLQECLMQKFTLEEEIAKLPKDLKVKQDLLAKINKEYTEDSEKDKAAKDELKSLRYDYDMRKWCKWSFVIAGKGAHCSSATSMRCVTGR